MESTFESLYVIDISKRIGPEYVNMMNDIARFVTIQVVIQVMLFTMDGKAFPFFSADFLLLTIFIIVGVMAYWLVLKKLIAFR